MSDTEPQPKNLKSDNVTNKVRFFDNAWDYFSKHKSDDEMATCEICSKNISKKGGSTSGLRRHLISVHMMKPKGKDQKSRNV